jgi:hypothetical protein
LQATTSAAIPDDTKAKKDSERIKYTKEFLMQFMEVGGVVAVFMLGRPDVLNSFPLCSARPQSAIWVLSVLAGMHKVSY